MSLLKEGSRGVLDWKDILTQIQLWLDGIDAKYRCNERRGGTMAMIRRWNQMLKTLGREEVGQITVYLSGFLTAGFIPSGCGAAKDEGR